MEESAGSEAQAMANNVFGDPSLPYPEMGLISLLIKFSVTIPNSRPLFMRVCMAVDRDQWVRECNCCHSACMLLDVVDSQMAVKAHVPLSVRTAKWAYSDWTNISDVFKTRTHMQKATWRDKAYLHQGLYVVNAWAPLIEPKFRPFQIEADGRICKGCHRLRLHNGDSGLGCDSVQGEEEEEELVFDNGISDTDADEGEEEDQFEPYPADDGFVTMEDRYD